MQKEKLSSTKRAKIITKVIVTAILGVVGITMTIPFIWMLSASMKINADVMQLPIKWIPDYFYPDNYLKVWNIGGIADRDYHFDVAYFNSVKIAVINVIGAVLTSASAGYAFAKINFRGRNILFMLYLSTMMIPSQITLIPKFSMFVEMGIMGTHATLILPGIFTITGTFLMRQFFVQISDDIREAAYVDGANEFRIWWQIMLPIAKTSLAALALMVFLWNWNAYLEPLIFLSDWKYYTIPVSLKSFIDESTTQYNLVMAASASALIPVFVVFLAGQKFFIKGLMTGSVKG